MQHINFVVISLDLKHLRQNQMTISKFRLKESNVFSDKNLGNTKSALAHEREMLRSNLS